MTSDLQRLVSNAFGLNTKKVVKRPKFNAFVYAENYAYIMADRRLAQHQLDKLKQYGESLIRINKKRMAFSEEAKQGVMQKIIDSGKNAAKNVWLFIKRLAQAFVNMFQQIINKFTDKLSSIKKNIQTMRKMLKQYYAGHGAGINYNEQKSKLERLEVFGVKLQKAANTDEIVLRDPVKTTTFTGKANEGAINLIKEMSKFPEGKVESLIKTKIQPLEDDYKNESKNKEAIEDTNNDGGKIDEDIIKAIANAGKNFEFILQVCRFSTNAMNDIKNINIEDETKISNEEANKVRAYIADITKVYNRLSVLADSCLGDILAITKFDIKQMKKVVKDPKYKNVK